MTRRAPPIRSTGRESIRPLDVDPVTSQRLGNIRQRNTTPELAVRKLLSRNGIHFCLHNGALPGSPDIANRLQRWAVFVHGCFWHQHAGCFRATLPKRNRLFWVEKFAKNRARDARAIRALRLARFKVVIVWECEIVSTPRRVARRLDALRARQRG
jgi:DNA mismatch endonuclease (patch repair protein)